MALLLVPGRLFSPPRLSAAAEATVGLSPRAIISVLQHHQDRSQSVDYLDCLVLGQTSASQYADVKGSA